MSIYSIGVSALQAAQAGLNTTSHNIANANTVGYSRQEVLQQARLPQNYGSGFYGQGADVVTVTRRYDQFLGAQVLEAQSQASTLSTQLALSKQVSNLLGDANGGLTTTLQDFFNSVNTVSSTPESIPARQNMVGTAQSLVSRFHALDQRLNQIRDTLNGQITDSVTLVNGYAQQIGVLNDKIVQLLAKTPNQPPNDLLDQRDQLVSQLSKEIRVSTINHTDGSVDVSIGTGQALVLGNRAFALKTTPSASDASTLVVAYQNNTGGTNSIPQSALQGGNLGGFLNFRQTVLDPAVNGLGRIAMSLADTFNQQHQQGIDLKGALGGTFFATATPRVAAATTNVGNSVLTATINSTSALTGNDYSVQFDGTNYNVYNTASNTLMQSFTAAQLTAAGGQTLAGSGVTLQLTAGMVPNAAGDSFTVRPTVDGAQLIALNFTDPSRVAAASPIRSTAATANTGSGAIAAASVSGGLPVNANLQQAVTITFNNPPTSYNVTGTGTGNPVNVAYTAGAAITYNGWSTTISGAPAAGDTFTVTQNSGATTDSTNMLKLAALQTTNTMANNTTSYQGAYGQLISQVGTQTRELTVTSKAQTSMLDQITKAQQAVGGVNLDEEAANLLRYQQAYQAAGKAMQIANTLFDTLLNLK